MIIKLLSVLNLDLYIYNCDHFNLVKVNYSLSINAGCPLRICRKAGSNSKADFKPILTKFQKEISILSHIAK